LHSLAPLRSAEQRATPPHRHRFAGPDKPGQGRTSEQPEGGPQAVSGGHTRPVLVVDDDRAILTTITEILELEGYPFITASDGAEALRRIAAEQPFLVLLDMRMPILNGWEVARTLRERGIMVPIVVMTAAQDARLWSEQIGAAGYLAKPFDLDDLLAMIERFFPD